MAKRAYAGIAAMKWTTTQESNTTELITAASVNATFHELVETNKLLREQNETLQAILQNLLALGKDGLHQVIRYHRREVQKANARARKRGDPHV